MKLFLLLTLVVFPLLSINLVLAKDGESAFIILKAKVIDEDREIKNICILRKRPNCNYLDPYKSFSEVPVGNLFMNVDFTDNELTGRGNRFFDEVIVFKFKKNRVYLIGELQLSERRLERYKMEFKQDMEMLNQACEDMPDKTLDFPLANAKTGKELDITCRKVLGK